LGFELWALSFGLWALGFELWALSFELKSLPQRRKDAKIKFILIFKT
jgi:hypothetical protein